MAYPHERRRNVRIPVSIPAGVYIKDRPHDGVDGEIKTISMGGAFVRCNAPIPMGKEILIEIRFAETRLLEAKVTELKGDFPSADPKEKSVVRWASNNANGFGVEFVDLKPESRKFLEKLVQYFQNLGQAGVKFEKLEE